MTVRLRPMREEDVALLAVWDDDPDVVAALGGPSTDWYDWPAELSRTVAWRELCIAEEDGRPIGFMQLLDACADESVYWGDVVPGTWALDIWIGAPSDRGRGLGAAMMRVAIERVFGHHGASTILIDPRADNLRAIDFYRRLGFRSLGERVFDDTTCLVMQLDAPDSAPSNRTGRAGAV